MIGDPGGNESIDPTNVNNFYDGIKFCPNAVIVYDGCETGISWLMPGKDLAQMTHDATEATVYAPLKETEWGYGMFWLRYIRDLSTEYKVIRK